MIRHVTFGYLISMMSSCYVSGTKTEHERTTQKHMKTFQKYLTKTNLQWAEDEEHWAYVKTENEDEIDESHKSQLKFEYDLHLLNNTIKTSIHRHQTPPRSRT